MAIVVASAVTLAAVAFLVAAPVFLVRRLAFLSRAERALGHVLDRDVQHDGTGASTARLTIGYRVTDGREFTLEQKVDRDRGVGEPVEVLYDPVDPERAYVRFGVGYVAGMTAVMVVMGLGIAYFAVVVMWR
ncbi:DUF3592 domain-containing protein [Spirillospora albida]|uniref:DUF3592 domain-containing protein n=1 Tax=Spirillospora albida TaxID=58123 RepID=UPI0012F74A3F|nr:DUF3592 domain-containing protein [Spirillospora albida]